jgi:branched-chain amino acid transport system ATP-binding protein
MQTEPGRVPQTSGSAPHAAPGPDAATPMLAVRGLEAGYGHLPVLRGVDLDVMPGEIVTLVGANGAGKSTLLRAIVGLLRPSAGTVQFENRPIERLAPEKIVRQGLALVPEGRLLFGPLSVQENLRLGAYARGAKAESSGFAEDLERVFRLFPVLSDRMSQSAETLSGGEQQMLGIARGLMSRPRLLLLDEPSLGLAPKVISEIFGKLDDLRAGGVTVLLVEQDVKIALKHADRGYVMRTGSVVLTGTARELLADDHVRLIYLGSWADGAEEPAAPSKPAQVGRTEGET